MLTCAEENKKIVIDSQGNASIVNTEPTPVLINFTISETPYQAEEEMTWGEWVESEYNINGYYVDEFFKMIYNSDEVNRVYDPITNEYVHNIDIIVANREYTEND